MNIKTTGILGTGLLSGATFFAGMNNQAAESDLSNALPTLSSVISENLTAIRDASRTTEDVRARSEDLLSDSDLLELRFLDLDTRMGDVTSALGKQLEDVRALNGQHETFRDAPMALTQRADRLIDATALYAVKGFIERIHSAERSIEIKLQSYPHLSRSEHESYVNLFYYNVSLDLTEQTLASLNSSDNKQALKEVRQLQKDSPSDPNSKEGKRASRSGKEFREKVEEASRISKECDPLEIIKQGKKMENERYGQELITDVLKIFYGMITSHVDMPKGNALSKLGAGVLGLTLNGYSHSEIMSKWGELEKKCKAQNDLHNQSKDTDTKKGSPSGRSPDDRGGPAGRNETGSERSGSSESKDRSNDSKSDKSGGSGKSDSKSGGKSESKSRNDCDRPSGERPSPCRDPGRGESNAGPMTSV